MDQDTINKNFKALDNRTAELLKKIEELDKRTVQQITVIKDQDDRIRAAEEKLVLLEKQNKPAVKN